MLAISTENLTKEFNGLVAVDSINLQVEEGELFGLLGPNGAGKTTTISMLCTMLPPSSGRALVWNYDILKQQNQVRNSIGIVFQDPSLDEKLTAHENLEFHGMLYRIPKIIRQERISELLELVELADRADNLVETYSGGMKRRLEIARGLMHHPKVLFLDEPTLGLDPQTRRHIWNYIRRLNVEENVTMILTTHYMEEADFLCNRIAIIDKGSIVASDKPSVLKDSIGGDVISIECSDCKLATDLLARQKWVEKVKVHNSTVDISVKNAEKRIPQIMEIAQKNGLKVKSLQVREPTLEDVFLHYTGRTMRQEEGKPMDAMRMRLRAKRRH